MTKRGETARSQVLVGKRADTRRDLITAARQVFGERGYSRATVADIVAAAGRSRASFYLYFAGKPDIYAAVGVTFGDDMASRFAILDAALARDDREAFRSWVDEHVRWMAQNRQVYAAWSEMEREEPGASAQVWRATVARWLDDMPAFRAQWKRRRPEAFARLGTFVGQLQFFHHSVFTPTEQRMALEVLTDAWFDQLRRPPTPT